MDLQKLREKNKTPYMPMHTHRNYIGVLGFLIPVVCIFFGWNQNGMIIQRSISAYYHTTVQDLFIAAMVGVSVFLFSYSGYDRLDRNITYIGGVAAAITALFPTTFAEKAADPVIYVGVLQLPEKVSGPIHLISAFILFGIFAIQCLFLFTKSLTRWRNNIYKICGITIVFCLVVLIGFFLAGRVHLLHSVKMVFFLECVMLEAFGVAWMIKGKIYTKKKTSSTP